MVSARDVVGTGLVLLVLGFVGNAVANIIPACEYRQQARSVRQLAKTADEKTQTFYEAQPFIDLQDGRKFDAYYGKAKGLKQSAVKLHEESDDLDTQANKYFKRALVFGYFTD